AEGSEFPHSTPAQPRFGHRTVLSAPLVREGSSIGVIGIYRPEVRPFSDQQIALLETFADQAVIAIENARLFSELEQRNRELSETVEQQTALADVLRVIASSPTDLKQVIDAVAETARRLCGADAAAVQREAGGVLTNLGLAGTDEGNTNFERVFRTPPRRPLPFDRSTISARAFLDRCTIYLPDPLAAEVEFPSTYRFARSFSVGSLAASPLLRGQKALGSIAIFSFRRNAFTEHQVKLLETFADQAVIAIENARLFQELNDSNANLREALEQQAATAEVLRVIASSPTNVEQSLNALVTSLTRLTRADNATALRFDGEDNVVLAATRSSAVGMRARAAGSVSEQ